MRTRDLACLLALAAGSAGAATYRWVDEGGVVNYGEKPPAGRPARAVDARPAGTIESRTLHEAQAPAAPQPAAAREPAGMAFETYIRLQPGMTEGEVLLRAGPPDHETVEDTRAVAKSLYYYPTRANPFLTVVTIRGGRVANLERNRKTD